MNAHTFAPSPAQQAYFDWIANSEGSAVLEAVAGAGKTTTIVNGLQYMHGQVLLLAYNSEMAKQLQERTAGRPGVFASTFHSAGVKALRFAFGKSNKLEVSSKKVEVITKALLLEKSRNELLDLTGAVCDFVSMAKQRGIGALSPLADDSAWLDMINHFALDESLPEGMEGHLVTAMHLSQEVLRRSNMDLDVIDFDDMVYLPLQRQLRMLQHDWVLVDEAQDTNPTRRALAAKLLRPRGRLVAVGDPCQAIYGFTGTDNDSLQQAADAFNCTKLQLTTSYRCPKAVVEVARRYADHIQAHDSAPDGEVVSYDYKDILNRVVPGDLVLCRFNKHLVKLVFALIRAGVPARIEGRAIGQGLAKLAGRWTRIKTLNALETRLEEYLESEYAKAKAKDDARRADNAQDTVDTLRVLIERAREQGLSTVEQLQAMILDLFENLPGEDAKPCVLLMSGHRSKGLERDRVHILGLDTLVARTSRDWARLQEIHLAYVMVTRAKASLFLVEGVER